MWNKVIHTTWLILLVLGTYIIPKKWMVWYIGTVVRSQFRLRPKYTIGLSHLLELQTGAIIFNHPSCFDFLILCFALQRIPTVVVNKKYMIGPLRFIAWRCGFVLIDPDKKGQSNEIIHAMQSKVLCIAPAGKIHQEPVPFHKSVFLARQPLMPVVLRYASVSVWDKQSLLDVILERMQGSWIDFSVECKPILYPIEPPDLFKERVENQMRLYLSQIDL